MSSFLILFIICGIVLALPLVAALVDSALELRYRVRRHRRPVAPIRPATHYARTTR